MYVRPTLDKLESRLNRLSQLFRSYRSVSYIGQHQYQGIDGKPFSSELGWRLTKRQCIVKRGFKLSDERQLELREEYRLNDYIGGGNSSFDLILSIEWKLGGEGFSFEAAINGNLLTAIDRHILYSELDDRDAELDHTVEVICRCMMDEIDSRSQRPE